MSKIDLKAGCVCKETFKKKRRVEKRMPQSTRDVKRDELSVPSFFCFEEMIGQEEYRDLYLEVNENPVKSSMPGEKSTLELLKAEEKS